MIGLGTIWAGMKVFGGALGVGSLADLIKLGAVALVVGFGAYKVGAWQGHRAGVTAGKAAQAELQAVADKEEAAEIRKRVENAFEKIGVDPDAADVVDILRGLATPAE